MSYHELGKEKRCGITGIPSYHGYAYYIMLYNILPTTTVRCEMVIILYVKVAYAQCHCECHPFEGILSLLRSKDDV